MSAHETLGLLLVRESLISRPQLYDALRLQRQSGRLLGTCLLSLGYVRPEALLAMLARQLAIPALPPGTLNRASPEAIRRVPREVARRLRILPYSWDGEMLGVALADGRVLGQLHEVAYHARAAVGAYVALETEIEAVLGAVYPAGDELEKAPLVFAERPRPARVAPVHDEPAAPPVPFVSPEGAHPPLDVSAEKALERLGFFDAVEQLYEAKHIDEVGRMAGRALLNYFQRVFVVLCDGRACRVIGRAGVEPRRLEVPESSLPLTMARLGDRQIAYGLAVLDARNAELGGLFGFDPGAVSLLAAVGAKERPRILVLADNYTTSDMYEDLHDIELLFKEAETGLEMLLAE